MFDPSVFNAWMILFLNILERPVPVEGQPADPELRKSWGWWKVKKWTVHILNRLYTRLLVIHLIFFIILSLYTELVPILIDTRWFFSQIWGCETSKPRKQSFCSNVPEEFCREDSGVPFKFVECNPSWWLFARQSYQSYPSIPQQ